MALTIFIAGILRDLFSQVSCIIQGSCQFGGADFQPVSGRNHACLHQGVAVSLTRGARCPRQQGKLVLMNERSPIETLDDLATRLSAMVPDDLKAAREDLTGNFRAILNGWFERMDLVTREEFEVQQAVLARTREKLDQLETVLKQLEAERG
jgi:BMFP domain-containing protein YqiC